MNLLLSAAGGVSGASYYWLASGVAVVAIVGAGWKLWSAIRNRLDNMNDGLETISGVPARGGRPAIPPLPAIVLDLADKVELLGIARNDLRRTADEHTRTLADHGQKLNLIIRELTTDDGDSFRDHVEAAAEKASVAAGEAHVAADRAAGLDQQLADHFGLTDGHSADQ